MTLAEENTGNLQPEQIARWLEQHPAFFLDYPQLIGKLQFEHGCGDAESLLLHQLRQLREQLARQAAQHQQLVHHAQDNLRRFQIMEQLTLALLGCHSTREVQRLLQRQLQESFGISGVRLWNYARLTALPAADAGQKEAQLHYLNGRKSKALRLDAAACQCLGLEPQLASGSALMHLLGSEDGLLVLAHEAADHFHDQQDTLFIAYLSELLHQLFSRSPAMFSS